MPRAIACRTLLNTADPVTAALLEGFAALGGPPLVIAVALSGGRDSMVLLHALADLSARNGDDAAFRLHAMHVHHGLSPNATAWAEHCAVACASLGIPLAVLPVSVVQGPQVSVEAAARKARYTALAVAARAVGAARIAVAHHRDDQAETLLLQLLRGAGPHGLAAMPGNRVAEGIAWWRPLLHVSGAAIGKYAADHRLHYVDDESNRDPRFARNALRGSVMPALALVAPAYAATIARAAAHQAEAATLIDELAAQDAGADADLPSLSRARLLQLPPHRARNLLRWFLRQQGLRGPNTARLREMLRQIAVDRPDTRIELRHGNVALGLHEGRLVIHAREPSPFENAWQGEAELTLRHGVIRFDPTVGEGIAARFLHGHRVVVRSRRGGEKLQTADGRPRRSLKSLLREARMPIWERRGLPLIFCGDDLACVPGIGVAAHCHCAPAENGFAVAWRPSYPDPGAN